MKLKTIICLSISLGFLSVPYLNAQSNPTLEELEKEITAKKAKEAEIKAAMQSLEDELVDLGVQREKQEKQKAELFPESIPPPEPVTPIQALADALETQQEVRGLKIRRSVYNKSQIEQPGTIQWVSPGGGDDSYSIDIGTTFSVLPFDHPTADHRYIGLAAEYHRNTQNQAMSDSFLGGLTGIEIIGNASEDPIVHYLQATTLYKNDQIHTDQGFLGSLDYTPLITGLGMGARADRWPLLAFSWQPKAGIQYEYGDDIDLTSESGDTFRGKAGVDVALYPFHEALNRRLELIASYDIWLNFSQSGGFGIRESDYDLVTFSTNWWLDTNGHFALGIDYLDGDNPQETFFDDQYWRLALKIKY